MSRLLSLALVALAAVSAVNSIPLVARATPPAGWIAEILESYDDYHTRYLAVGCREKHNTQFFDDCCHPMKKGETLEKNRKAYCRPGANPAPSSTLATPSQPPANTLVGAYPSPTSSPAPEPTSVPDEGDDCEDDDDETDDDDDEDDEDDDDEDCEEEPVSSTPAPSYSPTPVPTSSSNTPKPPSTPTPKPTSTSTTPKPSPTSDNGSSETHTGGHVTYYYQNGNYGACGNKHSDNDFIAALDSRTYGNTGAKSKYCGQKIRVSWQGKSVDVTVEDACPTCENSASVDLSVAAFKALAPLSVGELTGVTWELL